MNQSPSSATANRPQAFVSWRRDRWMFDGGGVTLLMYHKIAATPWTTRWPGLYVQPRNFDRQMAGLAAAGAANIAYDDLIRAVGAGETGFCLSFDDGFRNVFQNALPILQARKLRAVQFIVAGRIGGEDEWDRAIGEPPQRLMDEREIRDWLAAGQEIGAHTLTHPRLTTLPLARARAEIFESKQRLEDRFGVPVRHFCYPYGDHNDAVRDLVAEAGYASAPTVDFGVNQPGVQPLALRRVIACNPRSVIRYAAGRVARFSQTRRARRGGTP